jgi:hypothetical protein
LITASGEYLVVVQMWDRFATIHAHEEARLEFVYVNVDKPDFYGSLNRRLDVYIGTVNANTWRRVQAGEEVRVAPSQAPPKWTLRKKKTPEKLLSLITEEPEEPKEGVLWLDTENVQGATLMKWNEEAGGWCYAEDEDFVRVGITPPNKE